MLLFWYALVFDLIQLSPTFHEGKTPIESEDKTDGDEKSEVNLNDHAPNSEDEDMAVLAQLGSKF